MGDLDTGPSDSKTEPDATTSNALGSETVSVSVPPPSPPPPPPPLYSPHTLIQPQPQPQPQPQSQPQLQSQSNTYMDPSVYSHSLSNTQTPHPLSQNAVNANANANAAVQYLLSPPAPAMPSVAKDILMANALSAIRLAEQMAATCTDAAVIRRWYHTAFVYLEVLRAFSELPPELESRRRQARLCTRLCSRLLHNLVQEHDSGSCSVSDEYSVNVGKVLGSGNYGTVCLAEHR